MRYLHVRNIEKYQPWYKDRKFIWAKIHLTLISGDEDAENLGEIEFSRLIKFIVLETCRQRPTPLNESFLSKRGFDFGIQPLNSTVRLLSHFIDIKEDASCDEPVTILDTEPCPRIEKNRIDKDCVTELSVTSQSPTPQIPQTPLPFDRFWGVYPKKRSRGQAKKAWEKIKPNEQLQDRIFNALERAKTSAGWVKNGGEFIPHPATWLNAEGWEDSYADATPKPRERIWVD